MSVFTHSSQIQSAPLPNSSPSLLEWKVSLESYGEEAEVIMSNVRDVAKENAAINRRITMYKILVVLLAIAFLAINGYSLYKASESVPLLSFSHIEVVEPVGETALCPGDTLTYRLSVDANGPSVLTVDSTIWNRDTQQIVMFGNAIRLVVPKKYEDTIDVRWEIPSMVAVADSPEKVPWPAGNYQRVMAAGTTSRASIPAFVQMPFTIREDCYE